MSRKFDIVVAGHICLDITPSFPVDLGSDPSKVFAPGRLLNVEKPTMSTGGAVSNTGISMLRMGLKTQLMAKIGDDEFGGIIKQICEREGAAEGLNVVEGELSSYSCIIAPPNIDRIIFHCPGCNDTFTAQDIDYEMVADAGLFHFGYPSLMEKFYTDNGEELRDMFKQVKEKGTTTSLDQSYPDVASPAGQADWPTILGNALPYVDIFMPSVEEILLMLDRDLFIKRKDEAGNADLTSVIPIEDVQMLGQKLLDMGVKIALIKCGSRGLYMKTAGAEAISAIGECVPENADLWADRELWSAPFKVNVLSATGSGDSAIAGFLASIINKCDPEKALLLATLAGARAVQVPDAVSSMVPYEQMAGLLAEMGEKLPIELPGWTLNDNNIWQGPADK
ncbi:MAG: carbohydrate kinase family protein [Planctomycetota bacterium]